MNQELLIQSAQEFFKKLGVDAQVTVQVTTQPPVFDQPADLLASISVTATEPQILIGQNGQTLIEIQRILRLILNKKLGEKFHVQLDVNEYRKKKIEHLKRLARDLADEAAFTQEKKVLYPMSAYERRIIHAALADRQDISTESQGEGLERYVVISPK